ncbi:MAG TPA: JAB domain-containing protein [Allosphingosinicella sp.]|jgi:DNA repair protein RadC|uniref:JAB domain-containing protein n=1 Tax=Allosphingosinicella sp. TaxID=2823234 RepID=UPI002F29E40F
MPTADSAPIRIGTARDAANLLAPTFAGAARERLAVLYLGSDGTVLCVSETRLGGEVSIDLPLRAIIAEALRLNATGLILAHNHPSGDPMPSAADQAATGTLIRVAGELGIQIHDHLIFAGGECRSFRALGLL